MNKTIRDQSIFALEDDNELMTAALDGDLDEENKQMNRELIQRHKEILAKLDRGEALSQEDLVLVRDANEIHVNDGLNLNGRHKGAMALEDWLDNMIELSMDQAMKILEEWLDRDPKTPTRAYRALHTLWEEGRRMAWPPGLNLTMQADASSAAAGSRLQTQPIRSSLRARRS